MTRAVEEWRGKNDDTPVPARVKLRVLERFGFCCARSGLEIKRGMKWDVDHVIAIINGGKNIESNLQPLLDDAHKAKTRDDLRIKSKTARIMKRDFGLTKPKRPMAGGKNSNVKMTFNGPVDRRTGEPLGRRGRDD